MFEFIKRTTKTKPILEWVYKFMLHYPDKKTIWLSKQQYDIVMATLTKEQRNMYADGIKDGGYILKERNI